MQAIIDKLKLAKFPSRELDSDIALLFPDKFVRSGDENHHNGWVTAVRDGQPVKTAQAPAYTGSLDAASVLIPEGLYWIVGYGKTREDEPLGGASIAKPDDTLNPIGEAEAPTVPLAMCIAALEARLSLQQS